LDLLPRYATAVSLQSIVDNIMIVWVLPCQDTGSAGAAESTWHILQREWEQKKTKLYKKEGFLIMSKEKLLIILHSHF
jgi:hypothetical protein